MIEDDVKTFLRANYFHDGGASLTNETPLISTGIVDSIGMMALVNFLEERYGIEFLPREIDLSKLETVDRIAEVVRGKLEVQ